MQRLKTCLLIAEADRVLCHLVMFLTAFFHRMDWAGVSLGFWLINAPLVKVMGNPISDGTVFVFRFA